MGGREEGREGRGGEGGKGRGGRGCEGRVAVWCKMLPMSGYDFEEAERGRRGGCA